jgi:hypothetical protein
MYFSVSKAADLKKGVHLYRSFHFSKDSLSYFKFTVGINKTFYGHLKIILKLGRQRELPELSMSSQLKNDLKMSVRCFVKLNGELEIRQGVNK